MTERANVVIVGAGAAGLLAAARAGMRGRAPLLLEKNPRPGVKILMSGGTRCNLTHDTDAAGIRQEYGPAGKFLYSALAALGPRELVAMFNAAGVATKVESTGKVFPISNRATDVLAALLSMVERGGATLALGEPVESIERDGSAFVVRTSKRTLAAERLVITVGGQSYPGSGTTGDGYEWLRALGHTIVTPRPALAPLTTDAAWVRDLKGITVPDVGVQVIEPASDGAGKPTILAARRGSFLFAHFGMSGPAPMDVSRAVSAAADPRRLVLRCDFLPAVKEDALDRLFADQCAAHGKRNVASLLPNELPARLGEALLQLAHVDGQQRAAELAKDARRRLVAAIKRIDIPLTGTRGFAQAEVTAGGVALDEIDSKTMQSKLVPNLYLAGEILDLDGPIGGYNFQAAFSTGWLAGSFV